MNSNVFAKVNQIIKTCDAVYFGVIDENGFSHVSTVSPINLENIFEAYFSTGMGATRQNAYSATNGQAFFIALVTIILPL